MKDEIDFSSCTCYTEIEGIIADWIDYYNNERYQWNLAKLAPSEYYTYCVTGIYPLGGSAPNLSRSLSHWFPEKAKHLTFPSARKKTKCLSLRLPRKPDEPLESLSSVALSCSSVKHNQHTTDIVPASSNLS
jgi:hypothetical protein